MHSKLDNNNGEGRFPAMAIEPEEKSQKIYEKDTGEKKVEIVTNYTSGKLKVLSTFLSELNGE